MTDLYGLYDRQIRLFGAGTQRLIENACACVIQGPPYIRNRKKRVSDIGGEILKNLVLLGVRKIFANEAVRDSFKRLSPNDIHKVNEDVEVGTDVGGVYTVAILIDDSGVEADVGIYVCSRCMKFHDIGKAHVCMQYVCGEPVFADDCLLGAIVVQEWVKRLQGMKYVDEYQMRL